MSTRNGYLLIILGCMFSSKTSSLITIVRKYKSIDNKILVINHVKDQRYCAENHICSHDQIKEKAVSLENLKDLLNIPEYKEVNVIIVEEANFFKDLVDVVTHCVDKDKKKMIVCGLSGDYMRRPFGQILDLVPHADKIKLMTAFCKMCSDETPGLFTKRIVKSDNQELVGGADSYISVCRKHYLE